MQFVSIFLTFSLLVFRLEAQVLPGDELNFATGVNLEENTGKTFLSIMFNQVKPGVDAHATDGFTIVSSAEISRLFRAQNSAKNSGLVSDKVASAAITAAGNMKNLLSIADKLNRTGKSYTLYTLPDAIAKAAVGKKIDRYKLSTFFALASGGGVAVKINDKNYYYNVNYGTGKVDKDVQTGRSFGFTPMRGADDASDADYLQNLEDYIKKERNPSALYKTIIELLLASDARGYANLSTLGQHLATDFLAVFTAEQTRKLMEYQYSPYKKGDWAGSKNWDRALLEVSLISAFHAGQSELQVMFNGILTPITLKQKQGGTLRNEFKKASLVDYWQFSDSPCDGQKNRSGINITRKEFANLGDEISTFMRKNNPLLVKRVEASLGNQKERNIFRQLSYFIINLKAPKKLGAKAYQVSEIFTQFLIQVNHDANAITAQIHKDQRNSKVEVIQPKPKTRCEGFEEDARDEKLDQVGGL